MRETVRLGACRVEIDICPAAVTEDSLLEAGNVAVSRDMPLESTEGAGARYERGCERDFLHWLFSFLYKDTNLIPKFLREKQKNPVSSMAQYVNDVHPKPLFRRLRLADHALHVVSKKRHRISDLPMRRRIEHPLANQRRPNRGKRRERAIHSRRHI